jgi:hypothetical protein
MDVAAANIVLSYRLEVGWQIVGALWVSPIRVSSPGFEGIDQDSF